MCAKECNWSENEEIKIFQEYLRIRTDHPTIDYEPCVKFILEQGKSLELESKVLRPESPDKPVVLFTWRGLFPDLPSILLSSHMDVVAVADECWTHPPFGAEIDEEGRIFARGSQDMKCVGTQYLAAIRELKRKGIRLNRTLHIVFTPDEEIGGIAGMKAFANSDDFKALNVGFALDEGLASENDEFPVFYGERYFRRFVIKCNGKSGHPSLFVEDTAIKKANYIISKFLEFRDHEENRLKENPDLTIGDVSTINLTMLEGCLQRNILPPDITMSINGRLSTSLDVEEFERDVRKWCDEAGKNVDLEIIKRPYFPPTKLDNNNIYWMAFKDVFENDLKIKIKPQIFSGGTDVRYLRELNIPAIGFSPMRNTPVLLHEHDEFLSASTYIEGIKIYEKILLKVANV